MGEVTCKVIRTKLILRVQTEFLKILHPGGEGLPMPEGIVCIALVMTYCRGEGKHVSGLLDRHVPAVGLAVGKRIGSHIVGRERLGPLSALAVIVDMVHEALCQYRIVEEEERSGRIGHVHGSDGAVAVVLLREPENVALRGLHELVGVDGLTIGQGAELRIFAAAGFLGISHELPVECIAALDEGGFLLHCRLKLLLDGRVALPVPVWAEILPEILNRVNVIVSDHYGARSLLRESESLAYCHAAVIVLAGIAHRLNVIAIPEGIPEVNGPADTCAGISGPGSEVEIAPVDAEIVSLLRKNLLALCAGLEILDIALQICLRDSFLPSLVASPLRGSLEID